MKTTEKMRSSCVRFDPVTVYWLILGILECVVASVAQPICLTWNTTDSYLFVICNVPIAKHDIRIVDPSGSNRGQCIFRDSQRCLRSDNDDLTLEENVEKFTTLTLKTDKHNGEGEWKCRYGVAEKSVHVSYTEGIGPNINVEMSGEFITINLQNKFILSCFSCWTPDVEGVNLYVNGVWEDSIRYNEDLCYHKQHKCRPDTCSCSAKGKMFSWTFLSDLPYIKFTCSMKFKDATKSLTTIHQADLVYNGSVLIQTQTLNSNNSSNNVPIDADTDHQKGSEGIGYIVLGIVGTIILVVIVIACWRIHVNRKKNTRQKKANEKDKKNEDEVLRMIEIHEDKNNQKDSFQFEESHGDKNNQEDSFTFKVNGDNKKSQYETAVEIHGDKNNQEDFCPFKEIQEDKNKQEDSFPFKGKHTRSIFQFKEFKIYCIFSHLKREETYIRNLIMKLSKYGFQQENITLINGAFPDNIGSELYTVVQKLIIVFPRENELDNDNFVKLVERAWRHFKASPLVDILPIVRSTKANMPTWLNKIKLFRRSGSEFKDALLRCPKAKTMDGARNYLIIYQKRLNEITLSRKTCKQVANLGLDVLKGMGIELEKGRMSFRLNTLQSISLYEPNCLYDLVKCFVTDTSINFLRFYGFKPMDFGDFKLHSHMHKQFVEIFKIYFGMKLNFCWYHYRRNGFRHRSSFEEYLRSIFLNETHSVIYHNFETYQSRLNSFTSYPIENDSFCQKLAFAGFFYFEVSDYVQCFYCKGCLRAWNITDDPIVRHRENFKTCPFLVEAERMIRLGKKTNPIKNYTLNELKDRINSFKLFPVTISYDEVQRLAAAGFYYCGIAVDIICLACNIGFADLQNVGEILRLHKQYSPQCPNIIMCEDHAENEVCISNFVRYLEFEVRTHTIKGISY